MARVTRNIVRDVLGARRLDFRNISGIQTILREFVIEVRGYCPIARARKRDFKTANTPRGLRLGSGEVSPVWSVSVSSDELSVRDAVSGVPPSFTACAFA